MPNELQDRKIAFLAADGVEKVELEQPRVAVQDAGGHVELLSVKSGEIDARNHDLEPAGTFQVDREVGDARVEEFDGLVIPGGTVNADKLRLDESAVKFVRDFVLSGKPCAYLRAAKPTVRIDTPARRVADEIARSVAARSAAGGRWRG